MKIKLNKHNSITIEFVKGSIRIGHEYSLYGDWSLWLSVGKTFYFKPINEKIKKI